MKKLLALVLLLGSLLNGCAQDHPIPADDLTAANQYDLTALTLESGLTPGGQACVSGQGMYFTATANAAAEDGSELLESRLCRADLQTGAVTVLTVYADMAENAEAYSSAAAIFPAEDGGIWVMENTTHYIFDLPKNFDENLHDKWEYYQYRGDSTVLRQLASDGTEKHAFTMTNLQSSLTAAVFTGDLLLCAQGESILVLSPEGVLQATVPVPAWVTALAVKDETSVWVLTDLGEHGSTLYTLDLTDYTLTETGALPMAVYALSGAHGDQLYFTDRGSLFVWDTAQAAGRKLLDWQDCGRDRGGVKHLFTAEDGSLSVLYQNAAGEELELLTLTPSEAQGPEYDLVFGVLHPDDTTMEMVLDFNKKNNGGRIRVKDYSEYAALGQNGIDRLKQELTAGTGPDLLFSGDWDANIRDLAEGHLEDLSPYLQKDQGLTGQGLMDSILNALREEDGSLRAVAPAFVLSTAIGRSGMVGSAPITVSRVEELCQSMESDGFSPMEPYMTRSDAMQGHLQRRYGQYFTGGGCDLDQDAFLQGLDLVRLYPETLDWNSYGKKGISEQWIRVQQGHQLYMSGSYMNFQALARDMNAVGGDAVLCGWPDTPGGHALEVWESWGMLTSCRDKDLGWCFLRQVLTEEYQTSRLLTGLPTNRSAFRRLGQAAMQGGPVSKYFTGEEWLELSTRLTQTQFDAIEKAADSAVTLSRPVPKGLSLAVCQAAAEYLDGQGDAAEACSAAQSAALTLLGAAE